MGAKEQEDATGNTYLTGARGVPELGYLHLTVEDFA